MPTVLLSELRVVYYDSLDESAALSRNHGAQLPNCVADRDLIRAGHQQITLEWWETRRSFFDVFISQLVLDEAAAGDSAAARERLAVVQDLPLLDITDDVTSLAVVLVTSLAVPAKAATDAAHIALAAVHGMHFLLTWNCVHIANAEMAVAIERVCRDNGFTCPVICTPEALMGG